MRIAFLRQIILKDYDNMDTCKKQRTRTPLLGKLELVSSHSHSSGVLFVSVVILVERKNLWE
jgi:hypothetical protein